MRAAREAWFSSQLDLDPDTLVFIDETAAATNMARRYGRAPRGERCRLLVPQGHYKSATVTAALRTTGLIATTVFDGATNGERFRAYVTDTLVPVLKPGDTVILDNLQSHKVAGIREAIEAAGARIRTCQPTARTSTRSSRPSQSSRRCFAPSLPGPSRSFGRPSHGPSRPSAPPNAETTSPPPDTMLMTQPERQQL